MHSSGSGSAEDSSLLTILDQTDFETRGPVEPIEFGSHLPSVHPGRQEFDPPVNAAIVEDLAWPKGARHCGPTPPPADVPVDFRRACEPGGPTPAWIKRPRIDPGPSGKADLDPNECLELSSLGSSEKDFEAFVPGPDIFSRSIQDDRTHPPDSRPAGTDPQVLGPQADAIRSNGSELQCSHPMEARHLSSKFGLSGIVRPPHEAHEQRTDAIDCGPAEAFDLAQAVARMAGLLHTPGVLSMMRLNFWAGCDKPCTESTMMTCCRLLAVSLVSTPPSRIGE